MRIMRNIKLGLQKRNMEQKLIDDKNILELNTVCVNLEETIATKLRNTGIFFRSLSRVKSESSLKHKLATGKYGMTESEKKIQDLIGIRINLFYSEDMSLCEEILEDTFNLDNWSKSAWEENKFDAQKWNGVFRIPSKYLRNISTKLWEYPLDQTFEVQLRTVLFEGWHEIEHEMRYKYKSEEEEKHLWAGLEKQTRVMNSIIANLELCDWSIGNIFNSIAEEQFKNHNWEYALRSKYRLRIGHDELKPEIKKYFDEHLDIASRFFDVTKKQLVDILLNKRHHKELTPDRVVYLINKEMIHDDYIAKLLDKEQFVRATNKETKKKILPLVSDYVFHQEIMIREDAYLKACNLIYEWLYQHTRQVFPQMSKTMGPIHYETIGYQADITISDEQFVMDAQRISAEEAGVIWHTTAEVTKTPEGVKLYGRRICESLYSRDRQYSRPKFMRDIFNQAGYVDCGRVLSENLKAEEISYEELHAIISNPDRKLPVILVIKPEKLPDWAQNFEGYIINAETLNRTLAGISHILKSNEACSDVLKQQYGEQTVDGAVLYWKILQTEPQIFSMEDINKSLFEELSHSIDEDLEYEKAFRYRLRELVSEEFRSLIM